MLRSRWAWVAAAALLAGCSDGDSPLFDSVDGEGDEADIEVSDPEESEAPPSGSLGSNSIRIGAQSWMRTLPMTTGQCFLQEADGTLPTSAAAWGTLDGNDDLGFSASVNQDGTFEARVDDNATFFWLAGPNTPGVDDLEIELDFDAQTISGQGTFYDATTGESIPGSFVFTCRDDRDEEPPPPAFGPVVTEPLLLRWEGSDIAGPTPDTMLVVDGNRELWIRGSSLQYSEDGRSAFCIGVGGDDDLTCFAQESPATLLASGWYGSTITSDLPGASVDRTQIAGRSGTCTFVEFDEHTTVRSCVDDETQVQLLYESTGVTLTGAPTYQIEELVEWSVPGESDFQVPDAVLEALAE